VTTDATAFPGPPVDGVAGLVGSYVHGSPENPRTVVRWLDLLNAAQGNEPPFDPDAGQYLSGFCFPLAEYREHVRRVGSPRGFAGSASCPFLWFDIDSADLDAARLDAIQLVRFLLSRYPILESGIGIWFSGSKGFHVGLECLPGYDPAPTVPAIAKRLALALASQVGVRVDPAIYDHQRIFRLPNSKHPRTGLHKRPLLLDELELSVDRIRELARHPSGHELPFAGKRCQQLEDDWRTAAASLAGTVTPSGTRRVPPSSCPVVPKFVRDFIGFGDIVGPGRAVTLFRCAAVLAESGTPEAVIRGLLEEPAVKSGLEPWEVAKQIAAGIAHGRKGAP
jgi:hypothetical protein